MAGERRLRIDPRRRGSRPFSTAALRTAVAGLVIAALAAAPATARPRGKATAPPQLFHASDRCLACHNSLVSPTGEDLSFGSDWSGSMMASAALDPYWHAAVRREVLEHPSAQAAIEDKCSTCHMPMARTVTAAGGGQGQVFAHLAPGAAATPAGALAVDGVSCSLCHQITAEGLGEHASFDGGYSVDTTHPWGDRPVYGPYEVDPGRTEIMQSATELRPAQSTHVQSSELCATCHTLYTQALGPEGEVLGELPEQVPYQEWLHSAYRDTASCQACHMPVVEQEVPITAVLGEPRSGVSRHTFLGGNFFMQRMLQRHRSELGVPALPQELETAARRTEEHLRTQAARLAIEDVAVRAGRLTADLVVSNLAGHKLPTAYPSRRAWIHVTVRDRSGDALFESGAFTPSGFVDGNDNDQDPARFEPHHREISDPEQVQIYEAIMVDTAGAVTTGLLRGVRFVKDNRVLPAGFDKETADHDVAVHGAAFEDPDFAGGGDRTRYTIELGAAHGPYTVEAELWYQPISWRWAQNLRVHRAPEIDRFVGYYDEMAPASAMVLAESSVVVEE